MGKFDGVLIVSDYDGTFRAEKNSFISKENLDAVDYFCANGGKFTLCTGRDLCSYLRICGLFKVNAPVALSNGAVIYDGEKDQIVYEKVLPDRAKDDVISFAERFPQCGFEVHKGKDGFVVKRNHGTDYHMKSIGLSTVEVNMDSIPLPWNKFSIYTPTHPKADEDLINDILSAVYVNYSGYRSQGMVDVAAKGVTKGTAAVKLCEILGIERDHLYCVGDGWNDIPMLREGKIGFAPEDSNCDVLKEDVRIICRPEEHCLQEVVHILDGMYK